MFTTKINSFLKFIEIFLKYKISRDSYNIQSVYCSGQYDSLSPIDDLIKRNPAGMPNDPSETENVSKQEYLKEIKLIYKLEPPSDYSYEGAKKYISDNP